MGPAPRQAGEDARMALSLPAPRAEPEYPDIELALGCSVLPRLSKAALASSAQISA